MERGKEKVQDKDMGKVLDHIYQNAMGMPVVFKDQPTAETLKPNTMGYFDGTLYIKFANGEVYSFNGTPVS